MPEGDTLVPDRGRPAAVPRRPASDRGAGRGPGAVPQIAPDRRPRRSTRSTPLGKNLLIRFDSGLELRTHLRMNGSWHRYRPGERWRRPPSRARARPRGPGRGRGLLRRPGRRAVRAAGRGAPPGARRRSGRTCSTPTSTPPRRSRRLRDPARADDGRSARRCSTSGRWPASATSTRTSPVDRARVAVRAGRRARRRDARPARRHRPAAARRQRRPGPRPRARHHRRRPRRPRAALRLRPGRPAVPPLPDADRERPPGPGPPAHDLLVPDLPAIPDRERHRGRAARPPGRLDLPGDRHRRPRRVRPTRSRSRRPARSARRSRRSPTPAMRSALVRETFEFLLEREPRSSILRAST